MQVVEHALITVNVSLNKALYSVLFQMCSRFSPTSMLKQISGSPAVQCHYSVECEKAVHCMSLTEEQSCSYGQSQ